MKIAAAFTFKPSPEFKNGKPIPNTSKGFETAVYNHPTSGVKTKQDWSHSWTNFDTPRHSSGVWINGIRDRAKGPADDDHYYGSTFNTPDVDDVSKIDRPLIFKHVIMPAARLIAARHEELNERAKGTSATGVAVSPTQDSLECSFCGQKDFQHNKSNGDNIERFRANHKILKNGWCVSAMREHNAVNPIKGSFEEA